jgi:predicted  nucleic acid-binding Zn-ribbon protein
MNSQEIIEKIKVVLGLETTIEETHTESAPAPVVELAEVTIDSEELEALRSERDDLKKKVDELQAMIAERDAKDKAIDEVEDESDDSMEEMKKMEQKMSKPFSGAPVEEKRVNLSSPQSKRTDVKSRVFARLNA